MSLPLRLHAGKCFSTFELCRRLVHEILLSCLVLLLMLLLLIVVPPTLILPTQKHVAKSMGRKSSAPSGSSLSISLSLTSSLSLFPLSQTRLQRIKCCVEAHTLEYNRLFFNLLPCSFCHPFSSFLLLLSFFSPTSFIVRFIRASCSLILRLLLLSLSLSLPFSR